jgi:hypothetical protein
MKPELYSVIPVLRHTPFHTFHSGLFARITMASIFECPDNATDCLLRAILESTSSSCFNWDLLSFFFTAAIGVLTE